VRVALAIDRHEQGGSQTYVHRLAAGLRERGHRAEIFSWSAGRDSGTRVHGLSRLPSLAEMAPPLGGRPDIVHANAGILTVALGARVPRARLVTTLHRSWRLVHQGARGRLDGPMHLALAAAARDVIAPSPQLAADHDRCARWLGRRAHLVPNGVPVPAEPLPQRPEDGAFRVLIASRMVAQKRLSLALDAVATARRGGTAIECWVAGEGPEKAALVRRRDAYAERDAIRFLGWSALPGLLAQTDALLVTSSWEGSSYTMLETMASGRPVIGVSAPGVSELLTDGSGILVGGEELLTRTLAQAAADPAWRARVSQAGRARVLAEHDLDTMVDRIERIYARSR
jgi:glycosyltransferase involved in cell wall biosynthesis